MIKGLSPARQSLLGHKRSGRRGLAASAALLVALLGCATSPLGRNQLILFPDSQMAQMGVAAYQDIKTKTRATTDGRTDAYVQCVSEHIIRALDGGDPSQWEVTVFEDQQANAFALPGGKIGVYTGL